MVLLLVTALAVATLGVVEIRTNTLSIDGALNAQVPLNLLEQGRYATSYRWTRDFDHRVTTGPTVLLPVWLCFEMLGPTTTVAQLPNLVFLVLLMVAAASWAHRHAGPWAALAAVVLLLSTPRLLDFGLRLYGEVPALAFLLGAALLLDRLESGAASSTATAFAVGLLLGSALVTKALMMLSVPGFAVAALLGWRDGPRLGWRHWCAAGCGLALPIAAFETAKAATLGIGGFRAWWEAYGGRAAMQAVPGGMADTPGVVDKARWHLAQLGAFLHVGSAMALVLVALPLLVVAGCLAVDLLRGRGRRVGMSVIALSCTVGSVFFWWLVLTPTSRAWYRRVFDGVLLAEILAAVVAGWAVARLAAAWRRRGTDPAPSPLGVALAGCVLLVLVPLMAATGVRNLARLEVRTRPSEERLGMERVAARIDRLPADARLYGYGWFEAPELTFAARRPALDLTELPVDDHGRWLDDAYLVADPFLVQKRPETLQRILDEVEAEQVIVTGGFGLWRILRVPPYPPLPEVPEGEPLPSMFRAMDDARLATGVLWRGHGGRWIRRLSAYMLERDGRGCVEAELEIPSWSGEGAQVEVVVDGRVASREVMGPGRRLVVAEVPPGIAAEGHVPVELRLYRGERSPTDFSLHGTSQGAVLDHIGFVDCRGPGDG